MNGTRRAWWCEHRGTIAVGDKYEHWKMYCTHNRRCVDCHSIWVTDEFLGGYKGEIVGQAAALFGEET